MTLKESLMTIKDFRIDRCKKHNLCDILMIVLIGYLTGCKDIKEIHFSAEVSEEMLRKYLELPNGIPSTDTILRVLAGIDGKELEKVLADYARETFGSRIPEKEVIAIDGKTIRRSEYRNHNDESKSHKAAHVVSSFKGGITNSSIGISSSNELFIIGSSSIVSFLFELSFFSLSTCSRLDSK